MLKDVVNVFVAMARVGIFGYGGGPSVIPLIQKEVVDVYGWMDNQEFVNVLAMGNALPGPIATKMAAYTGYKIAGLAGAVSGVLGMVVPSFILILILAAGFFQFRDLPQVQGALKAVRPVVVALLAITVYEVWPQSIGSWDTALIAIVAFVVMIASRLHPVLAIIAATVFGMVVYGRR
jgi:chromate transporter